VLVEGEWRTGRWLEARVVRRHGVLISASDRMSCWPCRAGGSSRVSRGGTRQRRGAVCGGRRSVKAMLSRMQGSSEAWSRKRDCCAQALESCVRKVASLDDLSDRSLTGLLRACEATTTARISSKGRAQALFCFLLSPVLKHGPRSLTAVRVFARLSA